MRKILISLIVVILLCSMAVGVSAEWNNPFTDVKESHWYYDAVKTTVEKGIFNGMTENTFQPNGKMTRAMFMTTLAKLVNAEVGEYTGMPFTDVKADHWYAKYVQWAYDNKITSGMSADRFGVNDPITREQMVTLFYNTAAKYGADTAITSTYKFDKTYDASKIRDYAVTAMKWAMQNSIISGSGVNGNQIVVDPWGTATRAQAAQIITKYIEFTEKDLPAVTGLTINGNPIEEYTIVYSGQKSAANKLQKYIANATGVTLDVMTDSQEPEGPEIIVGKTNREDMGIVTADRDGGGIESFELSVQGDNLLIAAISERSDHDGVLFGVYAFAEEILEVEFYSDNVSVYNTVRNKNVPDGYEFKDAPGYEYRVVYWGGLVSSELSTGEPIKRTGIMHNMHELVGFGDARSDDPCLTDETNLATIEKNFLKMLSPGLEAVWVTQNDTERSCTCANCQAVYRADGGRAATLMHLMNRLAEAADKAGYPDVEIWTYAYEYSIRPVKFQLDPQVVIYFAPIECCACHAYNDPTCDTNVNICNWLEGWDAVAEKIYTWDYSTNFYYSQSPMPLTKTFRENKNWFYEHGIRGEFNNAVDSRIGEFDALKAYLLAELQWNPTMDEETYRGKIASFLNAYYGPGGKYINQYITLTEELCDTNHFAYSVPPSSIIASDVVLAHNDEIQAMWDAAEALCENDTQLKRIRISRMSWTYMYLDALYRTTYANGTDAQRAEYQALATEYYNEVKEYNLRWAETDGTEVYFNPEKSPADWGKA